MQDYLTPSLIFDAVLCLILVGAYIMGYKRGLLRSVWGITALIVSVVLTVMLRPYAAESFKNSNFATMIHDNVYSAMTERINEQELFGGGESGTTEILGIAYNLPEKYTEQAAESLAESAEKTIAAAAASVTDTVINIAVTVFLFLLIRIMLFVLYRILNIIFTLPVLKQTNKAAGGIVQLIIALAFVYVAFAAAAITGTHLFDDTVLCRYMYDNNLILNLFSIINV